MRKSIAAILTVALLLSVSAWGTSENELISDKAAGVMFVNDTEALPQQENELLL